MLKTIGAVIAGYIAMVVVVFTSLTLAYLAMGAERAFKPALYEVTPAWLAVMFAVSIVAAFVGGKVCALISKNPQATMILAGVVFVLGLLSSIPAFKSSGGAQKIRAGSLSNSEAMMNAKQPVWVALLMPFIGVAGVLIGGRAKKSEATTVSS